MTYSMLCASLLLGLTLLGLQACGANTGNHANEPQRTICFGALECGSSMKCVKGPNQINGVCKQLSDGEDAGATAVGLDAGPPIADAAVPPG